MSLLDKISGIAQKAKDNAVSKNIISKDKRLEQPFSNNIKLNDFFFEKLSTYGLACPVSLVAFDCIAGLLAVVDNSKYGTIKVFGKGISSTIRLPKPASIKYIQFKTGDSILIVIDNANTIITIDLRTKSVIHALPAQEIITSQTYCTGTDWLFIGYANGYVDVFDIIEGKMTPYQIPNLVEANNNNKNSIVVELQMHPTDLNTLLIGYETTAFIWSIRESMIKRSFSLKKSDASVNLTCLAWNPKGTRFIGGYDDGSVHIWDIRNDQKPALSYKLADIFTSSSSDQTEITEPVFQISWHANDAEEKSYVFIAGGLNLSDVHGLNILEFDEEGDLKEPQHQNIMPLPTDLSHFLILSTDPYYLGMHNPFGIAVITIDHSLNVYGLGQGYPLMKLPPAFEFINPRVLNACYIPQLPTTAFRRLAAITSNDRRTRYLPLTGGVAGPEHTYHIESNDLLLTIHKGEIIKFWDASYTALRPLSHLTVHCLDHLKNKDGFASCLDVNKIDGNFAVGFSDGSILIYEYHGDPEAKPDIDPKFAERNEQFISSCDETLKEISDLLEDMGNVSDAEEEQSNEVVANTNPFLEDSQASTDPAPPSQRDSSSTNPFLPPALPPRQSQELSRPPLPPRKQSTSCSFEKIDSEVHSAGFYVYLRISTNSPIRSIVSTGESIIAAATSEGSLYVFDIHKQLALFSLNLANLDYQASTAKASGTVESQDADNEDTQKPTITTLNFYNTYSLNKVDTVSTQLFVGLSNGHVYQFGLSSLIGGLTVTVDDLIEYLSLYTTASVIDLHVIDLHGEPQIAIHDMNAETKKPASTVPESEGASPSKRKVEYKHQENPHLIIASSAHDISVSLAGAHVKLYHKKLNKDVEIVHSQIIKYNDVVCLSLLLNNGKLSFYALPTLDFLLEMGLPNRCLIDRLQEASLSSDGRIVYWSGQYELEQYSFLHKPDFPIGDSVILFDAYRTIPPHPSTQTQPAKKTWLNTVAGSFQKSPFTVPELDSLMGRVPREDPNEVRRQKVEAYKAKMAKSNEGSSSSKGPGGVFSQLGDKVNERGERLNELDKKFQDLNDASGDFLKAVKDYNERQARKKWWEF